MNFLPGTHLLLWWLYGSPLLSREARQPIGDPNNTIFVSAVSLWEVWLKSSIGKLRVPSGFDRNILFLARSFDCGEYAFAQD